MTEEYNLIVLDYSLQHLTALKVELTWYLLIFHFPSESYSILFPYVICSKVLNSSRKEVNHICYYAKDSNAADASTVFLYSESKKMALTSTKNLF